MWSSAKIASHGDDIECERSHSLRGVAEPPIALLYSDEIVGLPERNGIALAVF